MRRTDFLSLAEVTLFTDWLASELPHWPIHLDIGASKFVPQGLQAKTVFGQIIPLHYRWRASGMSHGDWDESCAKTRALSAALRIGVANGDAAATMSACSDILLWGGERNAAVGARPFLRAQGANLPAYIAQAGQAMSLAGGDLSTDFRSVQAMNSMLTKVHAFFAADGLPIYDSRVSAAMAALVEYWRSGTGQRVLPKSLQFPLAGGSAKPQHRLTWLFEKPISPGQLSYIHSETPARWAGAKLRLAWVMAEILRKAPDLFQEQHDRMRALEAALFMVGYDLQCMQSSRR